MTRVMVGRGVPTLALPLAFSERAPHIMTLLIQFFLGIENRISITTETTLQDMWRAVRVDGKGFQCRRSPK